MKRDEVIGFVLAGSFTPECDLGRARAVWRDDAGAEAELDERRGGGGDH
jgi:hypothetical protein